MFGCEMCIYIVYDVWNFYVIVKFRMKDEWIF